jgi:hypothetical protein
MEIRNWLFHAGCGGLAKRATARITNRDGFNEKKRFS